MLALEIILLLIVKNSLYFMEMIKHLTNIYCSTRNGSSPPRVPLFNGVNVDLQKRSKTKITSVACFRYSNSFSRRNGNHHGTFRKCHRIGVYGSNSCNVLHQSCLEIATKKHEIWKNSNWSGSFRPKFTNTNVAAWKRQSRPVRSEQVKVNSVDLPR